jgi:flagellar basal-body rod protein FlgB
MFANLTSSLDFHSNALVLRAERQRVISSNIANADTPGYAGRDINFKEALSAVNGTGQQSTAPSAPMAASNPRHIPLQASTTSLDATALRYTTQSQPAMDGNSVDMDRERANFVDNAVRYEATLRFINGQSKTLLSAIQGQ